MGLNIGVDCSLFLITSYSIGGFSSRVVDKLEGKVSFGSKSVEVFGCGSGVFDVS